MQKNTRTTIELDKKDHTKQKKSTVRAQESKLKDLFVETIITAFKEGKKVSDYFEDKLRTGHVPMTSDYFRELSIVKQRSILSQRSLDNIESIITNYETRLRSLQSSSEEEP